MQAGTAEQQSHKKTKNHTTGTQTSLERVLRCRMGYTLIELLIAMVILGLLAVLVTPRLSLAREKAFVATMKSDMRNFAQAQESHFYDHAVYTASMPELAGNGFQESAEVSLFIEEATATGWSVRAKHDLTLVECDMFIGTAAPVAAASDEGVPSCV